jgi:hypothetical protein
MKVEGERGGGGAGRRWWARRSRRRCAAGWFCGMVLAVADGSIEGLRVQSALSVLFVRRQHRRRQQLVQEGPVVVASLMEKEQFRGWVYGMVSSGASIRCRAGFESEQIGDVRRGGLDLSGAVPWLVRRGALDLSGTEHPPGWRGVQTRVAARLAQVAARGVLLRRACCCEAGCGSTRSW